MYNTENAKMLTRMWLSDIAVLGIKASHKSDYTQKINDRTSLQRAIFVPLLFALPVIDFEKCIGRCRTNKNKKTTKFP